MRGPDGGAKKRSAVQTSRASCALPVMSIGLNRGSGAVSEMRTPAMSTSAASRPPIELKTAVPAPPPARACRAGSAAPASSTRPATRQFGPEAVNSGPVVGQSRPETTSTSFSPSSSRLAWKLVQRVAA